MTDKEILIEVLKQTKNNGYQDNDDYYDVLISQDEFYSEDRFIFTHDFAKAFWGEDCYRVFGYSTGTPKWQYNLKKMVLCEEPLKYLEKFL